MSHLRSRFRSLKEFIQKLFELINKIDTMINMSIGAVIGIVSGVLGLVAFICSAFFVVKSVSTKTTIASQKELIDTLVVGKEDQKELILDLQNKHIESVKSVSALQGQVDVLRNIPLKEISVDMKSIAEQMKSISTTQESIMTLLSEQPKAA